MDAIEIQFCRNRSRFKSLHFEDQMRLMTRYLKEGTMPFEIMTPIQKRDQENFNKLCLQFPTEDPHETSYNKKEEI